MLQSIYTRKNYRHSPIDAHLVEEKHTKAITIDFPPHLLEILQKKAREINWTLNDYVVELLLDDIYHEPNEATLEALHEAQSGALAGAPALDTSSLEAMMKSMEQLCCEDEDD